MFMNTFGYSEVFDVKGKFRGGGLNVYGILRA